MLYTVQACMCGLDGLASFQGANDMARHLLSAEGNARLDEALSGAPPEDEAARRQLICETLEAYADDAETYQEISLPGWTEDLIDELTEEYEDDVATIARMPGVTFLTT